MTQEEIMEMIRDMLRKYPREKETDFDAGWDTALYVLLGFIEGDE